MKKKNLIYIAVAIISLLLIGCTNELKYEMERPSYTNGVDIVAENLRIYIPNDFTSNGGNEQNKEFDYYINSNGNDCKMVVQLKDIANYDGVQDYLIKYAQVSNDKIIDKVINGRVWYTIAISEHDDVRYVYATIYKNYIYNITFTIFSDNGVCSTAFEMLDKTLYIDTNLK